MFITTPDTLYIDLRVNLFPHAKYINTKFEYMDQNTKLSFIMTNSAIVNKFPRPATFFLIDVEI